MRINKKLDKTSIHRLGMNIIIKINVEAENFMESTYRSNERRWWRQVQTSGFADGI